jgi:hypothetical protein
MLGGVSKFLYKNTQRRNTIHLCVLSAWTIQPMMTVQPIMVGIVLNRATTQCAKNAFVPIQEASYQILHILGRLNVRVVLVY